MNKIYLDNSFILKLFKNVIRSYSYARQKLVFVFSESLARRITLGISEKVKIIFKTSIFGAIARFDLGGLKRLTGTSKAVEVFLRQLSKATGSIALAFGKSGICAHLRKAKDSFFSEPLKLSGTVILMAAAINSALALIFKEQSIPLYWVIRCLFLFIGFAGLFGKAPWGKIKSSSFILTRG